eukprot:9214864-Pyramimonas_sp.AAC.1
MNGETRVDGGGSAGSGDAGGAESAASAAPGGVAEADGVDSEPAAPGGSLAERVQEAIAAIGHRVQSQAEEVARGPPQAAPPGGLRAGALIIARARRSTAFARVCGPGAPRPRRLLHLSSELGPQNATARERRPQPEE